MHFLIAVTRHFRHVYPPGGRRASLQKFVTDKLGARVVGDVDSGFRQAIEKTLQAIPIKVRTAVFAAGYEPRIANTMVDIKPELAGKHPRGYPPGYTWDNVDGALLADEKIIAIAQTCVDKKTGKPFPIDVMRSSGVLLHEYDHTLKDGNAGYLPPVIAEVEDLSTIERFGFTRAEVLAL